MPAPPKTTDAKILGATLRVIERHGWEAVTMGEIAQRVGIKAPSLYKRFASREALLMLAQLAGFRQLQALLEAASGRLEPMAALAAMAHAYRAYGHRHPHAYRLLFVSLPGARPEAITRRRDAVGPVFVQLQRLGIAPAALLPTARTFTAYVHGFVSMELAGAFQLGGEAERDFAYGLTLLLRSLPAA